MSRGEFVKVPGLDLTALLKRLKLGDTVTLVSADGEPLAVLVSLRITPEKVRSSDDWNRRWDALARKVSAAWNSDQNAADTLAEMRR